MDQEFVDKLRRSWCVLDVFIAVDGCRHHMMKNGRVGDFADAYLELQAIVTRWDLKIDCSEAAFQKVVELRDRISQEWGLIPERAQLLRISGELSILWLTIRELVKLLAYPGLDPRNQADYAKEIRSSAKSLMGDLTRAYGEIVAPRLVVDFDLLDEWAKTFLRV